MAASSSRIALTIRDLSEGGAQKVTLLLARGFVEAGYQVDLVLWEAKGAFANQIPPGVRLVSLNARNTLQAIIRIISYLRREQPQAMISSLLKPNFASAIALRLSQEKTRLAVIEHSHLPSYLQGKSRLASMVCRAVLVLSHGLSHHVVAVNTPAARAVEEALHYPEGKVAAIPNPIDFSAVEAASSASPPHPWLEQKDVPTLISMGRLIPAKGMDALIRAFSSVQQPSRLLILGDGPEHENLNHLIDTLTLRDRVELVGYSPKPYAFLHHAQAFALASRHESFGNVLVEALACSLPVVSTDCPVGPREILENGAFGTLVPLDDSAALTSALERALSQPRLDASKKRAHFFSVASAANAYRRLLLPEAP